MFTVLRTIEEYRNSPFFYVTENDTARFIIESLKKGIEVHINAEASIMEDAEKSFKDYAAACAHLRYCKEVAIKPDELTVDVKSLQGLADVMATFSYFGLHFGYRIFQFKYLEEVKGKTHIKYARVDYRITISEGDDEAFELRWHLATNSQKELWGKVNG